MVNQRCARIMLSSAGLAVAIALAFPAAVAGTLYRWVDENGNVTYQDSPPPDGAATEQVLDSGLEAADAPEDGARASTPVTLYTVTDCDGCELVRAYLMTHDVPYVEKDVEADVASRDELMDKLGRLRVPTLYVGDKLVDGYNTSVLHGELVAAGLLEGDGGRASGEEAQAESTDELSASTSFADTAEADTANQ